METDLFWEKIGFDRPWTSPKRRNPTLNMAYGSIWEVPGVLSHWDGSIFVHCTLVCLDEWVAVMTPKGAVDLDLGVAVEYTKIDGFWEPTKVLFLHLQEFEPPLKPIRP